MDHIYYCLACGKQCDQVYWFYSNGGYFFPTCSITHKQILEKENKRLRRFAKDAHFNGCKFDLQLQQWLETLRFFNFKCVYCDSPFESLDHYIPVSKHGTTTQENCFPACIFCNSVIKQNSGTEDLKSLFLPQCVEKIMQFQRQVEIQKSSTSYYDLFDCVLQPSIINKLKVLYLEKKQTINQKNGIRLIMNKIASDLNIRLSQKNAVILKKIIKNQCLQWEKELKYTAFLQIERDKNLESDYNDEYINERLLKVCTEICLVINQEWYSYIQILNTIKTYYSNLYPFACRNALQIFQSASDLFAVEEEYNNKELIDYLVHYNFIDNGWETLFSSIP